MSRLKMASSAAASGLVLLFLLSTAFGDPEQPWSDAQKKAIGDGKSAPPASPMLTLVERLTKEKVLRDCSAYPIGRVVADGKQFASCDGLVPGGEGGGGGDFSDNGGMEPIVPYCLANFFSLQMICEDDKERAGTGEGALNSFRVS